MADFKPPNNGRKEKPNSRAAMQFAEVVLLGNVAIRVGGKRVVWDSAKMQATDLPAADPFIRREYRKGWTL
jgi:hypothetical protein